MRTSTRITVRLPHTLYEQIQKEIDDRKALKDDVTVSSIVVQSLSDRYFKNIPDKARDSE